ncbi:hypothetical protein B0H11DRAFT_2400619 [Mycena galericulata]|nr:hypothetical protein B0H11DRAFT_2400619 [Mycena galericulata]
MCLNWIEPQTADDIEGHQTKCAIVTFEGMEISCSWHDISSLRLLLSSWIIIRDWCCWLKSANLPGRMAKRQAEWRNQTSHGRMRQSLSNFTSQGSFVPYKSFCSRCPENGKLNHYYWKCTVPPLNGSNDEEIESLVEKAYEALNRTIEDEEPTDGTAPGSILNVDEDNMDVVGNGGAGGWSIEEFMGQ